MVGYWQKYLKVDRRKKKPAGEAGSFIYYFDVKLLIVQHGILNERIHKPPLTVLQLR